MTSTFTETFLFLTKLAWNCRITLPMLVTAAFMAMDYRMQIEINVQTERIMVQEPPPFMIVDVGSDPDDPEDDTSWETISVETDSDDYETDEF